MNNYADKKSWTAFWNVWLFLILFGFQCRFKKEISEHICQIVKIKDFTPKPKKEVMAYFRHLNKKPKIIKWTYTKVKMLAKFGEPSVQKLAT